MHVYYLKMVFRQTEWVANFARNGIEFDKILRRVIKRSAMRDLSPHRFLFFYGTFVSLGVLKITEVIASPDDVIYRMALEGIHVNHLGEWGLRP